MYIFRETAIEWLKEQGFSEKEIEILEKLLKNIGGNTDMLKIPGKVSPKIAALVYLLGSITDEKGTPTCFDGKLIEIPQEAKLYYSDDVKIAELEDSIEKIQNIKTGRTHTTPKRRGSGKKIRE